MSIHQVKYALPISYRLIDGGYSLWNGLRGRPFNSWGGGGVGDFEKKFPASACRKKKIACSTNVIESLWEKKGKKYPAHHIARKKNSWWPEITHPHPQELNGRPLNEEAPTIFKVMLHRTIHNDDF